MILIINPLKLVLAGLTFVAAASCLPASVSAQDVDAYLRKADLDSDGEIEPHEMTGPIKRYLKGKGFSIDERHKIKDVVERASETKKWKAETAAKASDLKVPKFGVDPTEKVGVGAFGAATETVKYSEDVNRRARELFESNDRNGNDILDDWEIARMSWGNPRPSANDKNGDGRLTFREVQDRYRDREVAKQRSAQSSPDSGSSGVAELSKRRVNYRRSEGGSRYGRGSSRDEQDSSSRSSSNNRSDSSTAVDSEKERREKAEKFANIYFDSRDLDKNDVLEGDELKKVVAKSRYDKNRDGKVTKAEMIEASMPAVKTSRSTTSKSSSSGSRYSRSRTSSKGSNASNKLDLNKDRLVQMHEFSKTWTEKKLKEFRDKDSNGDGVLSPDEW